MTRTIRSVKCASRYFPSVVDNNNNDRDQIVWCLVSHFQRGREARFMHPIRETTCSLRTHCDPKRWLCCHNAGRCILQSEMSCYECAFKLTAKCFESWVENSLADPYSSVCAAPLRTECTCSAIIRQIRGGRLECGKWEGMHPRGARLAPHANNPDVTNLNDHVIGPSCGVPRNDWLDVPSVSLCGHFHESNWWTRNRYLITPFDSMLFIAFPRTV